MGRLTTNKPFDFGGRDHEQVPEIFDGILTTAESCQFSNNSAGSAALIIIIIIITRISIAQYGRNFRGAGNIMIYIIMYIYIIFIIYCGSRVFFIVS